MNKTANHAWLQIMADIIACGRTIKARGLSTIEILCNEQTFDMNNPICYHQNRKLNYAFSTVDALFIANGDNRVANLAQYNKNIAQFSDDGLIFNGAYGPAFNNQLMYAVNALKEDEKTRQAVITIWHENPIVSKDRKCTIALQFLIRDGSIHTKVTMRSSDVWLGIPYDFFNFTIMTLRVLTLYNESKMPNEPIKLGNMNWSAGSSHLYTSDINKIDSVIRSMPNKSPDRVPMQALTNWQFIVDSLVACRDKDESRINDNNLWRIRP